MDFILSWTDPDELVVWDDASKVSSFAFIDLFQGDKIEADFQEPGLSQDS
jgi:hypothetical protein